MPDLETKKSFLHEINLINFRNFNAFSFKVESDAILIHGPNGIGKTNILEAISLLSPGRGLRGAKFIEMNSSFSEKSWNITASISGMYGKNNIQISPVANAKVQKNRKELIVDGLPMKSLNKILENIGVAWLVPQMDQVFMNNSSARRKFFDRIVNNFSKGHSSMLSKYEYLVRERMHIIKQNNFDVKWAEIVERKLAEVSIIIIEARKNICDYLNDLISKMEYKFPKAFIEFEGELEKKFESTTALQLENTICDLLQHNRELDRSNGRTNTGIHRSDLVVYHRDKNESAKSCSTGEQKSLLISIFLAEVWGHIKWFNNVPILLLDDIMSHLDSKKRAMIFEIVNQLKAQVFITAVDADSTEYKKMDLQQFSIEDGKLII